MSRVAVPIASVALAACVQFAGASLAQAGTHDALIARHAAANGVPEHLVRRVIKIESRGRADAVHAGNYGLMQIRLGTARAMGYPGTAEGLLDPDTNLTYAVKYLAGAYRAAGCDVNRAVTYYQRGYYGSKHHDCGPAVIEIAEVEASAAKSGSARRKGEIVAVAASDVIKPRVVRAELISTSQPEPLPMPKLAKFEPIRIPPAVVRPVPLPVPRPAVLLAKAEVEAPAAGASETVAAEVVPLPYPKPGILMAKAEVETTAMATATPAEAARQPSSKPASFKEKFELAAAPVTAMQDSATVNVPLPRARPPLTQSVYLRTASSETKIAVDTKHSHAGKPAERAKHAGKKADDDTDVPGAVISFLKKITTPDKKARKRYSEEPTMQAQSSSQDY